MKKTRSISGMKGLGWLAVLAGFIAATPVQAQYYINQSAMAEILKPCAPNLDALPEVYYEYFVLYNTRGNNVMARNTFYAILGDGDLKLGRDRSKLVELLNRTLLPFTNIGDTLVVPNRLDLDFCAYSPFPRHYPGGRDFDKLFIIDKHIQAWAAYEYGKLARWGIVSTGAETSPTPNGRYNFNWKTEHRVSSLSPPGEPWDMYWVFNFHEERGIHIHQYAMPTGGPRSHGCVRLVEDDAVWVYNWADSWRTSRGNGFGSQSGRILEQGTIVLVIGNEPTGLPLPFEHKVRYPILRQVELPSHPYDIPPGSPQQVRFDRLRGSSR